MVPLPERSVERWGSYERSTPVYMYHTHEGIQPYNHITVWKIFGEVPLRAVLIRATMISLVGETGMPENGSSQGQNVAWTGLCVPMTDLLTD